MFKIYNGLPNLNVGDKMSLLNGFENMYKRRYGYTGEHGVAQ
jgi:hypothetical protein